MDPQAFALAWRARREATDARRAASAAAARQEACRIARTLVGDYGAKRVYAFGSLTREGRFGEHSDIDLAVEGLPPELYLRALGRVLRKSPRPVDLIELEDCPAPLRERVLTEGDLLEGV